MPEHYTLNIRGHSVEFHIYVDVLGSATKVQQLEPFLRRLPDQHLAVLYPIFVMWLKPGGRNGGGTWTPGEVHSSFSRAAQVQNTRVPYDDVARFAVTRGRGMIGLSQDRWERQMGRLEFTLMHEVGHCVDIVLGGLVPSSGATAGLVGMETNRCGAGSMAVRRAVEAYGNWICRPSRVFHTAPTPPESAAHANLRITNTLRASPSFRAVPRSWHPVTE